MAVPVLLLLLAQLSAAWPTPCGPCTCTTADLMYCAGRGLMTPPAPPAHARHVTALGLQVSTPFDSIQFSSVQFSSVQFDLIQFKSIQNSIQHLLNRQLVMDIYFFICIRIKYQL